MHYSYIKTQKKKQRQEDMGAYVVMITFAFAAIIVIGTSGFMRLWLPGGIMYKPTGLVNAKFAPTSTPEAEKLQTPTSTPRTLPTNKKVAKKPLLMSGRIRTITAYNAGDPKQTDNSPCIAANNKNICEALAKGEKHAAANFVPLGTKLKIGDLGIFIVSDRTASRFADRVDIAMQADEYDQAITFGKQQHVVEILK